MARLSWILGMLLTTYACGTSPAPGGPDAGIPIPDVGPIPDGGDPDSGQPDAGPIANFELNYGDFTETHWGYALTESRDGTLVVTGRTSGFGAGEDDYFFAEINRQGQMQRVRTFGSILNERGTGIVKTDDGFILSGWGYEGDGPHAVTTCQRLRLNEAGALQAATKLLVSVDSAAVPTLCLNTLDLGSRGFVMAGQVGERPGVLVHRFDKQGERLWSKAYEVGTTTYVQGIVELSDHSLLIVGNTEQFDLEADGYLLKLSADGEPQWATTYGVEGLHEGFAAATQLSNDEIVVAGTIGRWVEGIPTPVIGGLIVRIDPETGTVMTSKRFQPSEVAYSSVLINHLDEDRFVVTGMALDHEDWTASMVEFDADFNFITETRYGEHADPQDANLRSQNDLPPPQPGDEQPVFYHRLAQGGFLLGGISLDSFAFSDSSWLVASDGSSDDLCHLHNGVTSLELITVDRPSREIATTLTGVAVTEIAADFDAHERQGMLSDNRCQATDDPQLPWLESGLGIEITWQADSDVDVHLLHPDGAWGDAVLDCDAYNHSPDWGSIGYLHNPRVLLSTDDGTKGGIEQVAVLPESNKTYRVGLSLERGENSTVAVRVMKAGVPILEQSVTLSAETPFVDLTGVRWPDGALVD